MIDRTIFCILLALVCLLHPATAQNTQITFKFNTTDGLVYFLVIFFFMFNFGTPIARWIYVSYLVQLVDRASKEFKKISKRVSDRLSDAGRKVSQQMRG
jgi:Na+/alanine symporter